MSVKSKHSSKKSSIDKKEKKKKLQDSDEDIDSSEEELDLTKECHTIGYYLNDRAEMINQMFSVIKGNKLKAMLPPILKDCDVEQLKLQCLDQLLGMSEKRITCILEGETLETSSESEVVESDECEEKNGTSSSSTDRSEDMKSYTNNIDGRYKKRKGDSNNDGKSGKLPKTDTEHPEQGKTLLEILELEMRARAIRALLKQSNEKVEDQITEVNGVTSEVVDLTECEDEEISGKKDKIDEEEKEEEEDIDKKVISFEEKIEKSKIEKQNLKEDEKTKKFQAELELRNKLFKKKIYRTRKQRIENEEDDKNVDDTNESKEVIIKKVKILNDDEVIIEDPEEGEINTSEDESIGIKQEPSDDMKDDNINIKPHEDTEKVTNFDNETLVSDCNVENILNNQTDKENDLIESEKNDNQSFETSVGETSWRDRWLNKDGVQKLVKSSKIYAKVKKRIAEKSQKAKEEILTPYDVNSDSNSNSKCEMIEGRIEEYERLLGKTQPQKESNSVDNSNGNSQQPENSKSVNDTNDNEKTEGNQV